MFYEAHQGLKKLLPDRSIDNVIDAFYDVERRNSESYGYGVKIFTLSLVEAYLVLKKDIGAAEIEERRYRKIHLG